MSDQNQEPELSHPDAKKADVKKPTCGIIMPISEIDGLPPEHWEEIKNLIIEVATEANFEAYLVSSSEEAGIIQKRIVQNVYSSDVIICDVSARNPNVMFELGMRLAFDKATVIIKDDMTRNPFDIGPIEYLQYPRDLRFTKVLKWKALLKNKLLATFKNSKNSNYSAYLREFGEFVVAEVSTKEVSKEDFVMNEMREMKDMIFSLGRRIDTNKIYKPALTTDQRKALIKAQADSYYKALMTAFIRDNNLEDLDDKVEFEKFMNYASQSKVFSQYFPNPEDMVSYLTERNPFI